MTATHIHMKFLKLTQISEAQQLWVFE